MSRLRHNSSAPLPHIPMKSQGPLLVEGGVNPLGCSALSTFSSNQPLHSSSSSLYHDSSSALTCIFLPPLHPLPLLSSFSPSASTSTPANYPTPSPLSSSPIPHEPSAATTPTHLLLPSFFLYHTTPTFLVLQHKVDPPLLSHLALSFPPPLLVLHS
ncbi:hypothetical protein Pcinc_012517 [Petrolisthes cinctipes]|uniref:Uncharacterized protein n=1 Tax=Petrolisthes cinctipes TaxID=88211 RepID=A0AAE1KRD0_PETCI|nr:hypothetical protein Pcinc_012517 [Petrolisthes cinctipes]